MSIGVLNELLENQEAAVGIEYASSAEQRGDMFTKALQPAAFLKAREQVHIQSCPRRSVDEDPGSAEVGAEISRASNAFGPALVPT